MVEQITQIVQEYAPLVLAAIVALTAFAKTLEPIALKTKNNFDNKVIYYVGVGLGWVAKAIKPFTLRGLR